VSRTDLNPQTTIVSPSSETFPCEHQHGTVGPACSSFGSQNQEYSDLKRLIFWVFATMIPLTVLTIIIGIISDSLAIDAVAVDFGASLILHLFNLISIGIILRQNTFSYPHGTGKLENFPGFLYAAIVIPGALLIIASAVKRYLHPTTVIAFGPAQALLILCLIRESLLMFWAVRICRRHPYRSPMTQSYLVNMKLSVISSLGILAGLLFGSWMFSIGRIGMATAVDLIIAVAIAVYMCYCAIDLLVRNFRSLIDMPLPERDQYRILNALVGDFDA
jgi:cation diffusion facilitator family transporter